MFCEAVTEQRIRRRDVVTVDTTDYVDVAARARELGCRAPVGVALLPGNFATAAGAAELRYHEGAGEVRAAWRSIGLIDAGPILNHRPARGREAVGPDLPLVAFFGRELRTCPTNLITYALGAVASVLSIHAGHAGPSEVRFDAIVERPGSAGYVRIEYQGDACELVELAGSVRDILSGKPVLGVDGADSV